MLQYGVVQSAPCLCQYTDTYYNACRKTFVVSAFPTAIFPKMVSCACAVHAARIDMERGATVARIKVRSPLILCQALTIDREKVSHLSRDHLHKRLPHPRLQV